MEALSHFRIDFTNRSPVQISGVKDTAIFIVCANATNTTGVASNVPISRKHVHSVSDVIPECLTNSRINDKTNGVQKTKITPYVRKAE